MVSAAGAAPARFDFHCSGCGRCCNSPPALTLAELFHHECLFVGCLALRRAADGTPTLQTQAHDYPSLGACPALRADGLCGIHADRKPGMCAVVPLDPRLPEGMQAVVLQRRHAEAAWMQADCLADAPRAGHAPLVDSERIVDAGYRADFERQRAALDADRARWGDAVLAWMRPELARLPAPRADGYLALSLVAVLVVLARESGAQRLRGVAYAQRQVALIEANVARALERRVAADRAFTGELRRFAAQYRGFVASVA